MNLRPGIDTPPPKHFILVRVNLPFDDRDKAIQVLKAIEAVRREALDPSRELEGHGVVAGWGLNLLVGFGLRFFLGALPDRPQDEVVQNFPPGGVFKPRYATRFGIPNDRKIPIYLRTMSASGDDVWTKKRLTAKLNREPSDAEVQAAYQQWLADNECDVLLYIEANHRFLCTDLWDRLRAGVVKRHKLELAGPLEESFGREDGRDLIGWHDPKSNMDDMMVSDPQRYRAKIYLPHPAPMYPGENQNNRDELRYNGGTYLAHRKYRENLTKWNSDNFEITDNFGCTHRGAAARNHAVGRDRETGKVIRGSDGALLEPEPDAAEAHLTFVDAHIAMARGVTPAPFAGPFPPVKTGEVNTFHLQDIRIRRRGGNWREVNPKTGKTTYGLHFMSFQNNIQQTGFEFINNIWLINPLFRLNGDHLLDPEKGISEPIAGCYYFVPPPHRDYPGEVFFE
jgi:deferrochelatase/peroxidase EfeB